jgi:alanine dehydrogenase
MQASTKPRTVGFPRMHKEPGERRDFLPELVRFVAGLGAPQVAIEQGYGSGMGFSEADYRGDWASVVFTSLETCFQQDVVVVLRWPADELIRSMRPGTILVTMAHFPTRPTRVALLKSLQLRCVSLDCLKDDLGRRWVENLRDVGWNGVRAAFGELERLVPDFSSPGRRPIRVTIMGAGAVGGHAVQAATRYGDTSRRDSLARHGVPGVEVMVIDYDVTCHEGRMLELLAQTDLLVDATYRPDASQIIVPNHWLAVLPEHAVLLDLCVDPYLPNQTPPQVKGIEGMPEGNLDQYVFGPDHSAWDRVPSGIRRDHRRTALSCYSWPGVEPRSCMQLYGKQIEPILAVIVTRGVEQLTPDCGTEAERAIARAELLRY